MTTVAPQHANDTRSEAARLISELAPPDHNKVFFTNGGADAIENAVRMARLHTGRHKVLAAYRSYHGNTATAVTLTGDPRRWPNEAGIAGIVHFFGPYPYRSPFWSTSDEQEADRALEHLESVIQFEGPHTIAALVLETVVGTAGVLIPPAHYLAGVRELCTKYGIVYIADEVMAGFGRTGDWFAYEHFGVEPDLISFAKGVNSGYVPVGGVIISDEIAATFDDRVFPGGLTYSGHPLAAASIVATINAMRDEGIVENAKAIGENVIGPGLREMAERHPVIGEVRGMGVFWALDLVKNRETREMLVPYNASGPDNAPMAELVARLQEPRSDAVRQLQPAARRATVHCFRDRGQRGPRDPRRRLRRHREVLHGADPLWTFLSSDRVLASTHCAGHCNSTTTSNSSTALRATQEPQRWRPTSLSTRLIR